MSQVTIRKIVEGDSHLVVRVSFLSDGTGELVNDVVLSPSDIVPARPNRKQALRIMQ